MAQIIAGTYEILEEIGAGGGGIVYRGRHLRLGKTVVLKADKRTLSARPEALRREVDALKNLSHTYIPQVYDFVEESGTVYTVMDYIEGESLDKLLGREERVPQAQLVRWARQLLEALCYLHSRPPHGILHSDIKPANIMLTPEGDIRLIDFNIALALGEEGAVRVGFSQGYASPEHYGIDYSAAAQTRADSPETQLGAETQLSTAPGQRSSSTSGGMVLLDVRSDIYSLGATLYHLLTGRRPARSAKEVAPISDREASPAVAAIIGKAMAPDPGQRYQTAEEMLDAFRRLHRDDPRTKRHRRRAVLTAGILAALFLAGGGSTFAGLKGMERAAALAEEAERRSRETLAAVRSSENACRAGDIPSAVGWAVQALEQEDSPYRPQAQAVLTEALGVYDLSDGFKAHRTLELPSEPLKLAQSPSGGRLAAVYAFETAVFNLETGEELARLALEPSALSDVIFLDEERVLFAGAEGVELYDLAGQRTLWRGERANALALSGDGSRAAAVYKDGDSAQIYDTAAGTLVETVSFQGRRQRTAENDQLADPQDNLLALNGDGTRLAVSFANGELAVFGLAGGETLELMDPCNMYHYEGGFFGPYFAFSGWDGAQSIFAVVDTEAMVQTGGFTGQTPYLLQVDGDGVRIANDNILVWIDPETGEQTEIGYPEGDITAFRQSGDYAVTAGKGCAFFGPSARAMGAVEYPCDFLQLAGEFAAIGSRDTPTVRVLRLERSQEAEIFSYEPDYPHDEARLSGDGETVMLFRYDGFRLYSRTGELLQETALPDPQHIYDQQYRRDETGSYLEVIYSDGLRRAYSGEDGTVLWEKQGEIPDPSLYEEFLTDKYRITSPLHEAPAAYDRESGELVKTLEQDAYLTYVTQAGEYILTEYVSSQGERFGLLLDENCETLARLPNLCDIVDGTLVFDYPTGNLRQCRIYSLQELLALAESY